MSLSDQRFNRPAEDLEDDSAEFDPLDHELPNKPASIEDHSFDPTLLPQAELLDQAAVFPVVDVDGRDREVPVPAGGLAGRSSAA